jgi:hypothetical protein
MAMIGINQKKWDYQRRLLTPLKFNLFPYITLKAPSL